MQQARAATRPAPDRFGEICHMIGNTPLLALHLTFRGKRRVIYAKAEHLNMTGSIKDRMAFHILKKAYAEGRIQPGDTLAEATSGNTGISFAAIGRALGHPVSIWHHRLQGISDEFIPSIVALDRLDRVVSVRDSDAILMAQKLAASLGLAVGISSGANFLGALMAQNDLGDEAVVATVFADDHKKYLSTDLLHDEPVRDGYLTPEIELTHYEALRRVCSTCFEADEICVPA